MSNMKARPVSPSPRGGNAGHSTSHTSQTVPLTDQERLQRVERLARLMDSSFQIPGVPIHFGWDSILGLIPGIGDAVSAATGAWIMNEAYQSGVSKIHLARMLGNVVVDVTVGSIPLVGDIFDVFWKSNARNAKILEKHLKSRSGTA